MTAEEDRARPSSVASPEDNPPRPQAPVMPQGGAVGSERANTSQPQPFWARIKRHKVVEWTLAYVAFGYALLHGVQMLRETFAWSLLVPRLTVVGLMLGAPIAVTLAWYHGHRAQHRVSGRELSILIALLVVAGSVLWTVSRNSRDSAEAPATKSLANATPAAAAFSPPPHSIAVLPFVNISGDKEQEYFSDGLSEELLNSLARIGGLQVAARTSSFYFKSEHADLQTIAHRLNVTSVLEGSVRRSGNKIRVTAQLNNAVTGFHLWSQTYDRDLGDVLELQTDIATAVASALKVSLLGDTAARVELGGTRNPAAFDAYLRGLRAERTDPDNTQAVIEAQTEAIRLDPKYALALAARSLALTREGGYFAPTHAAGRDAFERALADARSAVTLTPELPEAHAALAEVLKRGFFEFARAKEEYDSAVTLAPGNATALATYGYFVAAMGDANAGISAAQRAVALDRLNVASYENLGRTLWAARRFAEARAAYQQALALDPGLAMAVSGIGLTYYAAGDLNSARSTCALKPDFWNSQVCLAVTYDKLGQHAEGEAVLAKLRAAGGDLLVYQYAQVYAQWGNRSKALEELEKAVRVRDSGMHLLKVDFLLDPIRGEPRFQAIERELKFPD